MILKKLGVAMLAALALSAVVAGTSQAAMWNSSGIGTWTSQSEPAKAKIGAKGGVLTSKVLASPFKITFEQITTEETKLEQRGSSALHSSAVVVLTSIVVHEPAGCKSTTTIKTNSLIGTAQMGNTEATKNSVYTKFAPASGEVLATITLSGCAAAGSYQLKGIFYMKANNPTGTAAVWQEAVTSEAINSSQGGALKLGPEKAVLDSSMQVALKSEETYSLQE